MTLKDLSAVARCEIYTTAYAADGDEYLITDFLRGSSGFMSLEIAGLHPHKNGLDLVAEINISPGVLRFLDKESKKYYNK